MQICLNSGPRGFAPGARLDGDTTGSRRSKPLLKDLDFQIFSKFFPNISKLLQALAGFPKIRVSNIFRDIRWLIQKN
jgi:hypothetical protein